MTIELTVGMSRIARVSLLIACLPLVYGMKCSWGDKNIVTKTLNSCPGLLDPSDKSYCCYDYGSDRVYCCDAEEFALTTGFGIIIPVIVGVIIVISLIVCCVSCLCCSCCPWYRRRHPGTVYGKVQTTHTVPVLQPNVPPSYNQVNQVQQNDYVPYPTNPAGFPQSPPQYNSEAYAKQAPYNPAYPPQ